MSEATVSSGIDPLPQPGDDVPGAPPPLRRDAPRTPPARGAVTGVPAVPEPAARRRVPVLLAAVLATAGCAALAVLLRSRTGHAHH